MLCFDQFYELRVLRVVDMSTEGYVIHRYLPGNHAAFHGFELIRFRHNVL